MTILITIPLIITILISITIIIAKVVTITVLVRIARHIYNLHTVRT